MGAPSMNALAERFAPQNVGSIFLCTHRVASALEYFLEVTERRRAHQRLAPFRVERLDYRNEDREAFS